MLLKEVVGKNNNRSLSRENIEQEQSIDDFDGPDQVWWTFVVKVFSLHLEDVGVFLGNPQEHMMLLHLFIHPYSIWIYVL